MASKEVLFDNSRLADRRAGMITFLEAKERIGLAKIVAVDENVVVALHEGREFPTIIRPVHAQSDGRWVADRVFGDEDVIGEMEKFIDDKGQEDSQTQDDISQAIERVRLGLREFKVAEEEFMRRVVADHVDRNGGW